MEMWPRLRKKSLRDLNKVSLYFLNGFSIFLSNSLTLNRSIFYHGLDVAEGTRKEYWYSTATTIKRAPWTRMVSLLVGVRITYTTRIIHKSVRGTLWSFSFNLLSAVDRTYRVDPSIRTSSCPWRIVISRRTSVM